MRYALTVLPLLLCLCANQMPPSGGPDDTQPPRVVHTAPAAASVDQADLSAVVLAFSEWVDPRSAKRHISVFPSLSQGYTVGVRGRKVTVKFSEPLADSTTYHVIVGAGLEDLHRVAIGTPYHLVFSTGPVLDSGMVFGCVLDPDARLHQPKVALYACRDSAGIDSALLAPPTYVAQTDSTGRFSMTNIGPGLYAVVGFVDRDANGLPGFGLEQTYAPAHRIVAVDSVTGPVELFGVAGDTATVHISSLKAHTARLLLGQWGQSAKGGRAEPDSTWRIEPADSTRPSPAIDTILALDNAGRFAVRLRDSLTAAAYRLVYRPGLRVHAKGNADTLRDTVRFNGVVTADTTTPSLTGSLPRGIVGLMPELKLFWSEPVRCLAASWPFVDTTGDTVTLSIDTSFGDTITMVPRERLAPQRRYVLAIPPERFEDLAGNHPVDTADTPRVSLAFSSIVADSICLSLSGKAECPTGFSRGMWVFSPLARNWPAVTTPDSSGAFSFDSIPRGRGTLRVFDDLNDDKRHSAGSLFPWRPPEPIFAFDDTVEARARWDIEGLTVNNCELCRKAREAGDKENSRAPAGRDSEQPAGDEAGRGDER